MPRPPMPATSVRSAVAVRPPRPMTLPEIVGVHVNLDGAPAAVGHHVDADIVGVVHDSADQVFDGVDDD